MEDLAKLPEFLVTAKKHTYASGSEGTKTKDRSTIFVYEEKDWHYQDQFYGDGNHFLGHETVWKKKRPVWGLNYRGVRLDTLFEEQRLYKFLREALTKVDASLPLRGPAKYESNNLRYANFSTGDLRGFRGVEFIYETGRAIYQLDYHGGALSQPVA